MSNEVVKIFDELKTLHLKKDHDYSGEEKHLANFKEANRIGVKDWKGAFIRLQDKYIRCCHLIAGMDAQVDEKLEDTLQDLAVYSCIVLALRRLAKKEEQPIAEKYNQIAEEWKKRIAENQIQGLVDPKPAPKKDPVEVAQNE